MTAASVVLAAVLGMAVPQTSCLVGCVLAAAWCDGPRVPDHQGGIAPCR